MSDLDKSVYAHVIVEIPALEDVLAKEGGSLTLKTATFKASLRDNSSVESTCELNDFELQNISNIQLRSDDRQFSFEGRHHWQYEGGGSTSYRVIVRYEYRRERYISAHIIQI